MRTIGPSTREENLDRLARETFDVAIIGGGITGAGCALDAASRGLSVALVDKGDFASGTSSKSSKMIHGGLRYLANYDFRLTWEAAHERDLLSRLAPHLVRPLTFLYPVFRKGKESRFASIGLTIYDVFASLRGSPRHRRAKEQVIRSMVPSLDPARVVGAWTYYDCQTDDARLVFEIIRTAHAFGAASVNHAAVEGFERTGGRLTAARITDAITGRALELKAKSFVNATGVWAHQVGALDEPDATLLLRPAKGVHVVVPKERLPIESGCILPSGIRDRRSIFAVPWGGRVVVGTTDTDYEGSLDEPSVGADDLSYLLTAANKFLDCSLTPSDVVAAWAGLRPLRAVAGSERTADLSRRHAITVSGGGLVSITGGKLTTYRRMAADAIDVVCKQLGHRASSKTSRLRLGISKPPDQLTADVAAIAARVDADPAIARRLVETYGDLAPSVLATATDDPARGRPLSESVAVTGAEIRWAVEHEMAVTLDDVLARRTRLSLTDRTGGLATGAPDIVAQALGWDAAKIGAETAAYARGVAAERGPAAPRVLATS